MSGLEEEIVGSAPVILDVGGIKYKTTVGTLTRIKDSVLTFLVTSPLEDCNKIRRGAELHQDPEPIFIDRDGESFRHILNYLRNRTLPLQYMRMSERLTLLEEAKFFNMRHLVGEISRSIKREEDIHSRKTTQEKQYMLVGTPKEHLSSAVSFYTTAGWDVDALTPTDSVVISGIHNKSSSGYTPINAAGRPATRTALEKSSPQPLGAGVDEIYHFSRASLTPVHPGLPRPGQGQNGFFQEHGPSNGRVLVPQHGTESSAAGSDNVAVRNAEAPSTGVGRNRTNRGRETNEKGDSGLNDNGTYDVSSSKWYVLLLSRKLTWSDVSLLDKLTDV